jgi:hypothetical protein
LESSPPIFLVLNQYDTTSMTIGITAAQPLSSGDRMAAVDGHPAGAEMSRKALEPTSADAMVDRHKVEVEGKDLRPQKPEGGRYIGPPGINQGRSISMPIIEQVTNNQRKSRLQKRALAARGELRLPSFKSLGVALPRSDQILTPPDDADSFVFNPLALSSEALSVPRSAPNLPTIQSTYMASTDQDTPPQESESTMPQDSDNTETNTPTGEAPQATRTITQNVTSTAPVLARHPSSSSEEETPRGPVWLERAVDAVGQ